MKTHVRNKRKFWTLVIALGAVAALAVGITIAWFSDTQTLTNVATVAGVDITLDENVADAGALDPDETTVTMVTGGSATDPSNPLYTVPMVDENGQPVTTLVNGVETDVMSPLVTGSYTAGVGATYETGLPGASYVKAPTVTNKDQPVFLRLVVSRTWGAMTPAGDIDYIILHLVNSGDWTLAAPAADVNGDGIPDDVFYYNTVLATGATTSMPFDYFTISSNVGNAYVNVNANVGVKAEALQASGLESTYTSASLIPETLWDSVEVAP